MVLSTIADWTGEIGTVVIGAGRKDGGTRTASIVIGGERDLPCAPVVSSSSPLRHSETVSR
jgi:CO dehydrogenase/acetyl-CoA synthase delta subunit